MTLYDALTGQDRTRARVRGLVLAHGLATGCVQSRDLSHDQRELAAWAVFTAQQDASRLLDMQREPDHVYMEAA